MAKYLNKSAEEMDEILEELWSVYDDNRKMRISDNIIEEASNPQSIEDLVGWKFDVKEDGEHKTDFQIVTYTWNFYSPSGKKTTFETDMSLMNGWSMSEDIKLKI